MIQSSPETTPASYRLPELRFEDQRLTSHAGLVLLQPLFRGLDPHDRLAWRFAHLARDSIVGLPKMSLILIVHLMRIDRRMATSAHHSSAR